MFIKPIVNAAYPGTLAGLDLAVIQLTIPTNATTPPGFTLAGLALSLGAIMFLASAFAIFLHTLSPSRRKYWSIGALTFLLGLGCSMLAVFILAFLPPYLPLLILSS